MELIRGTQKLALRCEIICGEYCINFYLLFFFIYLFIWTCSFGHTWLIN